MTMRFAGLLLLSAALVLSAACSDGKDDTANPASSTTSGLPPPPKVADDAAAVAQVSATVASHKLTTLKPECLSYVPYPRDAQAIIVDVHELHNAACGGDPDVAPRLFTIEVDRASGRMRTDATDPAAGLFHDID
jgi:hypothetical protein